VRFCFVGIANTAVDWASYYALIYLIVGISEPTAKAFSFLIAVLNSYSWNTVWTFNKEYKEGAGDDKRIKRRIFFKFVVVSLIGWGINYIVFGYVLEVCKLGNIVLLYRALTGQSLLPLIMASLAAIIWNFLANKFWTYRVFGKKVLV